MSTSPSTISMVEKWKFESADFFLEAISPLTGALPSNCSFRGHGSSDYELIPSAWRYFNLNKDRCVLLDPNSHDGLIYVEAHILLSFVCRANQQGLPIPGGFEQVKELLAPFLETDRRPSPIEWPPPLLLETLALAQHFGTPTRLLDWTLNPYIAAFFAAEDCIANSTQSSFSVYVYLRAPAELTLGPKSNYFETGMEMYSPPYAGNPNARSQQGLFIYIRTRQHQLPESIDAYYGRRRKELNISGDKPFIKMTLQASEARKLLSRLETLGISASTLFPGYDGASRASRLHNFGLFSIEDYDQNLEEWNRTVLGSARTMERMMEEGRLVVESEQSGRTGEQSRHV